MQRERESEGNKGEMPETLKKKDLLQYQIFFGEFFQLFYIEYVSLFLLHEFETKIIRTQVNHYCAFALKLN